MHGDDWLDAEIVGNVNWAGKWWDGSRSQTRLPASIASMPQTMLKSRGHTFT